LLAGCLRGNPVTPTAADAGPVDSGSFDAGSFDAGPVDAGPAGPVSLTVAEWNLDFFGRADAGPTDDDLQATHVAAVMAQVNPDVWALEEVCDEGHFADVVQSVSASTGRPMVALLANDPNLGNPYADYGGTWGQKTAVLFDSSVLAVVDAQLVYRRAWGANFSSRDPLEVHFKVRATGAELWILVVHLKALAELDAYDVRVQASQDLQGYVNQVHANDRVMVIGDWNDDLDGSILAGKPSPFENFLDDPAYQFATLPFANAQESTTADHTGHPIDHHLITAPLFQALVPGSAEIIKPNIAGYADNTSDHYPTVVRYLLSGD